MGTEQQDSGPAMGKWLLILGAGVAAGLLVASIWSVARILSNFGGASESKTAIHESTPAAGRPAATDAGGLQEEIEKQYIEEHGIKPVTVVPAPAPAAVTPANQVDDAVKLQKVKSKVNQRLVERLKKYAKDHPKLDNRELEKEIKKREKMITPAPQGAP